MRRKKILIFPKLCDRQGDITKQWFVELSMRNPATGEMVRRRVEKFDELNINKLPTVEERYALAQKIIASLNEKIQKGWTIFNDMNSCIYEDQLQYSNVAKVYKKEVSNNTYSHWVSIYIKEFIADLKPETRGTYISRYRTLGVWLESKRLQQLNISNITNALIIEFFNYLKKERNQSQRTYRSYHQLIFAFFEFVLRKGNISSNPVYNIPENRVVKDMGAERIFKEDLDRLMALIDKEDAQLGLACRFEYYCGLRPGYEVRLLKIGDIDFRKGISKVRVSWQNAKVSRKRDVAIPDIFLDYLLTRWKLNEYDAEDYVIGKNNLPGKQYLGKNNLRFRFNKFRTRLNLPVNYKLYSFKHTGAVTLAEQGETIINIRDHLGHTSIQTTEVYLKRLGFNDSKIIRREFPKI